MGNIEKCCNFACESITKRNNYYAEMIPRQGHINNVKDTKKVALMFGVLDIICTDRQTDRQTDRRSLKHEDGAQRRLFPDQWGMGRAAAACLYCSDL